VRLLGSVAGAWGRVAAVTGRGWGAPLPWPAWPLRGGKLRLALAGAYLERVHHSLGAELVDR
jgi:hypothetical protein